ncbi:hypothetical protein Q31b_45880 [Novipirellula aureliae]|uniref:Uncharacterized protein n=1 Tax=Novipirellula aureliae TaxID=2527966 RepID=A0A5C6DST1_9BACT|nr:hypothetical protein [Novipirellula aureliae]TWU37799.1 hypothetical protein Q31b_45880 [Novipirellula aureliae]
MDRHLPSRPTAHGGCQTLLWIGPRDAKELHEAYDFCERSASQIAYRHSIADAIQRPAMSVDRILFARINRAPFDWRFANTVLSKTDDIRAACLIGSLCDGVPHNERFAISESNRLRLASSSADVNQKLLLIKSHAWNQSLPAWLDGTDVSQPIIATTKKTVAVIAATFAAAEPILDLISDLGHSVVWIRSPESVRVRNIDQVIWDDSLASPATFQTWRHRTESVATQKNTKHAWIASSPRIDQSDSARRAGVDLVLSKPFSCRALSQWLAEKESIREGGSRLQNTLAKRSKVAA